MDSLLHERIAFLGAGSIAEVWIERLLTLGALAPGQVFASDVRSERLDWLRERWDTKLGTISGGATRQLSD